jgi:hypothetical protein
MARLFPRELAGWVRKDPKRQAEVRVYDALAQQLGVGWRVFYSVAWLGRTRPDREPRDGEADFVIAHSNFGYLVLEVKGGGIRYDGVGRRWWSVDRRGETHAIDDPFLQAVISKNALLRKLLEQQTLAGFWIPTGHAVCFPDVRRQDVAAIALPPQAECAVILASEDLAELAARLRAVAEFWHKCREERVEEAEQNFRRRPLVNGATLMAEIEQLIAPVFELPNPLRLQIADQQQELIRLKERQFNLLGMLNRVRRAAVSGCAGSGKTLLAVEKTRRLAREGFHTLLTCASEPLAEYLRECSRSFGPLPGRVEVLSFADFCRRAARDANTDPLPAPAPGVSLPASYAEALEKAASDHPNYKFDAILVDEGQDFDVLSWLALERCLKEGRDSVFYVFYDDNQRLRRGELTLPTDLVPFHLNENVRNTRAIYRLLLPYYEGGESVPSGPTGRPAQLVPCASPGELKTALSRTLRQLLLGEGLRPDAVAVLTPKARDQSALRGLVLEHGYRLTEQPDPRGQGVFWCPINDFKGLERDVIIIAELHELPADDARQRDAVSYVALSRARHHLILIGPPDLLETLKGKQSA